MSKELEEAKRICRLLCGKRNKNGKREYKTFARMQMQLDYSIDEMAEAIETVLQALNNSTSKEVIKEKLEDYQERERYYDDENIVKDNEYYRIEATINVLEEILEENK